MPSERNYPFDPHISLSEMCNLQGLDKLRCVEDRVTARWLHELYFHAAGERTRKAASELEQIASGDKARKTQALADACLAGRHGVDAQQIAEQILIDTTRHDRPRRSDERTLEVFADELRKFRAKGAA